MIVCMKRLDCYLMRFNSVEILDCKINHNLAKSLKNLQLIKRVIKPRLIYSQIKKAIARIKLSVQIMELIVAKHRSIVHLKIEISKNYKAQPLRMLKNLQIMISKCIKVRVPQIMEIQYLQAIDITKLRSLRRKMQLRRIQKELSNSIS